MTIQIEGEFTWKPENLIKEVEDIIVEELHDEGVKARREIRKNFSPVAPSLAGQPPAVRTGRLSRSVMFRVNRSRLTLQVGVDSSVPYAFALEFGRGSLKARPYLRPQRLRTQERLTKRLKKRLR